MWKKWVKKVEEHNKPLNNYAFYEEMWNPYEIFIPFIVFIIVVIFISFLSFVSGEPINFAITILVSVIMSSLSGCMMYLNWKCFAM